jgi:3-oxoacyl-(acyl-carrier-protein) synthase
MYVPTDKDIFKKPFYPIKPFEGYDNNDITLTTKIGLKLLSSLEEKWFDLSPMPIFSATSTGGIKETETIYKTLYKNKTKFELKKHHYFYDFYPVVKEKYGEKITDCYTFATACSSGGHAMLHAFRFIKNNIIDKALVMAVDSLSINTMFGFDSLKLVSPNGTRPLSKDRDGMSLGEGGALFVLESNPKTEPIAEIIGAYSNSDGYHITSPNPQGNQQRRCMLNAIEEGGLKPDDIDYINAHGTGTPTNDEIEVNVIKSIFSPKVKVTSLKGFIGHTVGSSALIELALCLGMLKNQKIFQQSNIGEPIDENYIPRESLNLKVKHFIKNSFGFGGNNVCLLVRNHF